MAQCTIHAVHRYVILIRGINVGGHSKVPMAALRQCLQDAGFSNVLTYIASGNVILASAKPADAVKTLVEAVIDKNFDVKSGANALVLSRSQLQAVVGSRPNGFGNEPEKYHSDAIFLIGISAAEAIGVFSPRKGVDSVWPGKGVIYSQRLSAERTKSRLNRIVGTPAYKSMTIRSWNTTVKLLGLLQKSDESTS